MTPTEHDRKYPKKPLIRGAKKRAIKYKLDFNLAENDFDLPDTCPILKCKLKYGHGPMAYNSATLDRLNIDLGYVKGNVWVLSLLANQMKSNSRFKHRALYVNWVILTLLDRPQWLTLLDLDVIRKCYDSLLYLNAVEATKVLGAG